MFIYFLGDGFYRLVVNAATRDKDLAWIDAQAEAFDVEVRVRDDLAMIAVQGPQARDRVLGLVHADDRDAIAKLGKFASRDVRSSSGAPLFIARTGYTGEDGFEVALPEEHAVEFWDALVAAGVAPAGLAARDTLRLEAGLPLYGQDMDESATPYEAGLGWTVSLDEGRAFNGRDVLEAQRARGDARQLIGPGQATGCAARGQKVLPPAARRDPVGTFSPPCSRRSPARIRRASRARSGSTSAAARFRCGWWPIPSCAMASRAKAFDPRPRPFLH